MCSWKQGRANPSSMAPAVQNVGTLNASSSWAWAKSAQFGATHVGVTTLASAVIGDGMRRMMTMSCRCGSSGDKRLQVDVRAASDATSGGAKFGQSSIPAILLNFLPPSGMGEGYCSCILCLFLECLNWDWIHSHFDCPSPIPECFAKENRKKQKRRVDVDSEERLCVYTSAYFYFASIKCWVD